MTIDKTGLTIDEAIQHAEKVAQENELCIRCNDDFNFSQPKWRKCALEHRQLAEWLKDYRRLLGAIEDIKLEIKEYRYGDEEASETDKDRAEAYNFGLEKALEIIDKHTSGKEDA